MGAAEILLLVGVVIIGAIWVLFSGDDNNPPPGSSQISFPAMECLLNTTIR